jgi:hypothetical protein
MRIIFCIVGGKQRLLDLQRSTSISSAKYLLSIVLNVPSDRLIFVHAASILDDATTLGSLDFTRRNFISVTIDRRPRCAWLSAPSEPDRPKPQRTPEQSQLPIQEQVLGHLMPVRQASPTRETGHPAHIANRTTESDVVARFLTDLTLDDFLALERVMATNVSLDIAIPIFIRHGKDVNATIEQIHQMYGSQETE